MKLRPRSSQQNREFASNVSGGVDLLLGTKSSLFFANFIVSFLIGTCSIGAKLLIRKELGIRAVNPLFLILHFLVVYLFATDPLSRKDFLSIEGIYTQVPFIAYYISVLFILALIHIYNISVLKLGSEDHSHDRGFGPLYYFFGSRLGDKRDYLLLIDPLLVAMCSYAFFSVTGGKQLAIILLSSSAFLLLEELLIRYRSWHAVLDLRDADLEAKWLSETHDEYSNSPQSEAEVNYRVRKRNK